MSYSEFITIYGIEQNKIDYKRVATLCNKMYKTKFNNSGYWDEDNIFDFISKQLNKSSYKNSIFESCNHDGINDDEVNKCHKVYCKVLNCLYSCVVQHHSQNGEPYEYTIYDEDHNIFTQYKESMDESDVLKDYLEKLELEEMVKDKGEFDKKEIVKGLLK